MPGPHVDLAYNNALAELEFEKPQNYAQLPPDQQKRIDERIKTEYADQVFKDLEKDPTLNASERQEIYQKIAAHMTAKALQNRRDGNTLARGSDKGTRFMNNFMEEYAKEYHHGVTNGARALLNNIKLPTGDPEFPNTFPPIGTKPDDPLYQNLKPGTIDQLNQAYAQVGPQILNLAVGQMSKLSPEVLAVMKAIAGTARQNGATEEDVGNLMANTLHLRSGINRIYGLADKMMADQNPDEQIMGQFLKKATPPSQSFFNTVNTDTYSSTKNEAELTRQMRTSENLNLVRAAYTAVATGDLGSVANELDQELAKLGPTIYQHNKQLAKPELDQIAKLDKKLNGLSKPWSLERFRAFFTGGADKVINDTKQQKANLEAAITKKTSPDFLKNLEAEKNGTKQDFSSGLTVSSSTSQGKKTDVSTPLTYEKAMEMDGMKTAFNKFAEKEGARNYQSFVAEVQELQQNIQAGKQDLTDLKVQAYGIYNRYLDTSGETPISLNPDRDTREQVSKLAVNDLDKLTGPEMEKMFDAVEQEMKEEFFSDFQKTVDYHQHVENGPKHDAPKMGLERRNSVRKDVGQEVGEHSKLTQSQHSGLNV